MLVFDKFESDCSGCPLCAQHCNEFTVTQTVWKGNKVIFNTDGGKILNSEVNVVSSDSEKNWMNRYNLQQTIEHVSSDPVYCSPIGQFLWHHRLVYLNMSSLKNMSTDTKGTISCVITWVSETENR